MTPMRFELEEWSGLLLLPNDNLATPKIKAAGRLDWDRNFANIPEVAALQPGQVVFDVGAFIGDTTRLFLNLGCEVHAFEPRPDTFVCLLHNCPEAHCYNVALGTGQRFETATATGGNLGGYPLRDGLRYAVGLDALCAQRLDFLKIDTEGMDAEVLSGGIKTVMAYHPTIHIECNPAALAGFGRTETDLIGVLKCLGYTRFQETYRYGDSHWDLVCV